MKLRQIADSRGTGDKGNISNISVIAFESTTPLLLNATAERVKDHFREIATVEVTRYELPQSARSTSC